jgi:PAS domain S-box-containing protein
VLTWNQAAERMFGYTPAEIVGRSIRLIIPEDRQAEEDDVLAHIRRGQRIEHFETIRRRKDGRLIPISLTVSPIVDEAGTVVGASKIARDITDQKLAEAEYGRVLRMAQENARIAAGLNRAGATVSATLDRGVVAQAVTDVATAGTNAEFGAFFYNVVDPRTGGSYQLYALSGAPREAFAHFPNPRATSMFGPTFRGEGVICLDDVTADPRFGQNPPYRGMPEGHLPVRSYLAVPVKSRAGDVLGGLFFGHSEPNRFTEADARLASGVAMWASLALENARLYESAQVANSLKDEFLATLSHELRTPLNAILGYARMIRSGVTPPDALMRAVATIERNGLSLSQIVEDILDISRIISGKIRLNVQRVELPAVVNNAVDAMLPAAEAKGVCLETILDPHAGPIFGDPDRLQQVSWNVVSNAVKFTPRGGKVQVHLQRVNSHVELVVRDTGVGIDPAFLPFIFERFRQADAGSDREHGGLGLGLGIARQLIELHGGTIDAASPGVGHGTTIRVKLPLMIAERHVDVEERVHPLTPRFGTSQRMASLSSVRVLAVDDDRDALTMVCDILQAAGAYVAIADSGPAALETIEIVRPDVIVLDVGMPKMDGFAVIAKIRQHENPDIRDIPAAALTAYARSDDRIKALRSGFNMHLAKPIDPAELTAAVAALANRRKKAQGAS